MEVSVIVPARDAAVTLPRALKALASQSFDGGLEVIVVDDGSRDGTPEVVRAAEAEVKLLRQPPKGPGAARNLGASHAEGSVLAFCDADVFPTRDWLRHGVAALRAAPVVQGRVLPDPGAPLGPFDRTIWITGPAALGEAASLFVTREVFARLGGFPDGIRPRRGKVLAEDALFAGNARRLRVGMTFCAEALAHHAVFPRSWRGYVSERGRRRFFPAIVRAAPDLRETFLFRRVFLDRRCARFDLALLATALGWRARALWPLLGVVPYLRTWWQGATRAPYGQRAPVLTADLAADAVGAAALLAGSARHRALVL